MKEIKSNYFSKMVFTDFYKNLWCTNSIISKPQFSIFITALSVFMTQQEYRRQKMNTDSYYL